MDKIFVHDYIREIEIGAYHSEVGCKQRIKFNVSLELKQPVLTLNDDVDKILSYELIIDAISASLLRQRYNLLETLADQIATHCLRDSRVYKANISIEKLDRIDGSMGVSICRTKNLEKDEVGDREILSNQQLENRLFYFSSDAIRTGSIDKWLLRFEALKNPPVILIGPTQNESWRKTSQKIQLQLRLSSMDQNALIFSCRHHNIVTVGSKSELNWAIKNKKFSVLCPSQFVMRVAENTSVGNESFEAFVLQFARNLGLVEVVWVTASQNDELERLSNQDLKIVPHNVKDWSTF